MASALGVVRRASARGHGAVILLEGEPGIGKTAVFDEVVEQAARMAVSCAVSNADPIARISPAAPLLLALRSGGQPFVTNGEFANLAQAVDRPLLLIESLTSLLAELAHDRPLLVGIDDVHWLDPVSRFILRALPIRLASSPVIWLFASRTVEDGLVADLGRSSVRTWVDSISLTGLFPADIIAMARDRLAATPHESVSRMLEGVGGNPFFATQILNGVLRSGVEGYQDFPTELVLGVRRRVGELDDSAARLLQAAAVYGQPLSTDDVRYLLPDLTGKDLSGSIDAVVRSSLIDISRDNLLGFRHELIREAIYRDMTDRQRRQFHERSARHISDSGGDPLAVAAHARAGITPGDESGAAILAEAARRLAISMPEAASELILTAFRTLRPSQSTWLSLGQQCVDLLGLVQRCAEAIDVGDLLLAHLDDDESAGNIEIALARSLWLTGRSKAAYDCASLALARPNLSPALRARLRGSQALALSRTEPAEIASAAADGILREADSLNDHEARQLAWHALAEAARNRGDHAESARHYRALRAGSGLAFVAQEIQCLQHLDRFHDVDVMLGAVRRDLGVDEGVVFLPLIYTQSWYDYNQARFGEAEAGAQQLLKLARERGSNGCIVDASVLLSLVSMQRGDVVEARRRLGFVTARVKTEEEAAVPEITLVRGWVTVAEGDVHQGIDMMRPAVRAGAEFRFPWPWKSVWLRTLVQIGLSGGDRDFVEQVLTLADVAADRNPNVASLVGTAAQLRGLATRDLVLLDQAANLLTESPRPLVRASAFEDLGLELVCRQARREGAALLDQAWEIYRAVEAKGPLQAMHKRMRQAGLRSSRKFVVDEQPTTGWQSLTHSERKVARLVGAGYTNKQAGEELGVSVNTVGTHLRTAFKKLGVRSRVQLTNYVHEHGAS
jgi:DNA-binding CsgD family transcriptional regulator/tetratricopeptide (TPR) repeat protein